MFETILFIGFHYKLWNDVKRQVIKNCYESSSLLDSISIILRVGIVIFSTASALEQCQS